MQNYNIKYIIFKSSKYSIYTVLDTFYFGNKVLKSDLLLMKLFLAATNVSDFSDLKKITNMKY